MGGYGLLGRTLGHSYSPAIHALLGDYPYALYEKEPEELEDFLLQGPWDGLNVTIPYKKAVVPYCQALSPLAKALGSVNTLLRRPDGSLYGDNTDAWGFGQMLKPFPCAGKKALVLGSGGASVTVQQVLRQAGAAVTVISRRGPDNYDNLARHRDARILVNTTPVGMYPKVGVSPVDLRELPGLEAVLDVVYNPVRTKLILEAEALGIPHASGLTMLVGQAARSAELFTGQPVSPERLADTERRIARSMENIILIGMPGSGKTTLGIRLARQLGRPFADSDALLAERCGMDAGNYLSRYGEEAFRSLETQVLEELGKASGLVIATGGGCVTRPENYALLHQNGTLFFLTRSLEKLPTKGRPLSGTHGVQALYEARRTSYLAFSDHVISNDGFSDEAVKQILEVLSQ